ncbi:MAG: VOC family protein, partial [Alphaproteobacteria bacterium]|nr:VOC family protein [Alphaproteobacteria bacterium]
MTAVFTHVALHVRDLSDCVGFYRDFCGLKVVHERGEPGDPHAVWLAQPGREREFIFVLLPGGPGRDQAERD